MAYDEPLETGDDREPVPAMRSFKNQAHMNNMSPRKPSTSKKSIKSSVRDDMH